MWQPIVTFTNSYAKMSPSTKSNSEGEPQIGLYKIKVLFYELRGPGFWEISKYIPEIFALRIFKGL
jgi:hypothetical protein